MAFSANLKLEVKKKAAFSCCRCHEIGVDIHHIIPRAENGTDTVDNAAPLCQNCHDRFGANAEKRKEIRQMRDWWYEVVKEKYSDQDSEKLAAINENILQIQQTQECQKTELQKLREDLAVKLEELIKNQPVISPNNVQEIASTYITATKLGKGVYANFRCSKCNSSSGLLVTNDGRCPHCKAPIL
jgi:predicted house-cleaning noncanonical NTP pyrophosphatase (MazG superfamily)